MAPLPWRQTVPAGVRGGRPGELPAVFLPAAALLRELHAGPACGGAAAPVRPHPQPSQLDGDAPSSGAGHPGVLPSQPHHQVGGRAMGVRVVWGWATGVCWGL